MQDHEIARLCNESPRGRFIATRRRRETIGWILWVALGLVSIVAFLASAAG